LNDEDLREFVSLQTNFADSDSSWSLDIADIDTSNYDLSVKKPNGGEVFTYRTPNVIINEIAALDAETTELMTSIRELV